MRTDFKHKRKYVLQKETGKGEHLQIPLVNALLIPKLQALGDGARSCTPQAAVHVLNEDA